MNIGVNTRLLIEGKMDGIGWFACESLKRIVANHPEHQFFFFYDREPARLFLFGSNVHPVVLHPQARHPILWYLFFEHSIPRALRRYGIDLFLSPDGYIPLHTEVPTLTVIHDLNFEHATGNLKASHQRYMSHYFPLFAQKATRIATVSTYSKNDIAATYHIDAGKIDVVYNGSHANYHPYPATECQQIQERYASGKPYFIFISTILKRKNLANLLKAFDKVREGLDVKLLVVGTRVWWKDELKDAYDHLKYREDVVFLGHLDAETLAKALSGAIALVYPSYFEGFGIPILEAFYAETPVIASNTTSIPEVAGDAALLTDPDDSDAIAAAMKKVGTSEAERERLIERGRMQREKYSCERTATLLWDSLMKTYNRQ